MLCTKIQDLAAILFNSAEPFEQIGNTFLMLCTKIQDMAAILFKSAEPFEQIGNTFLMEGPCEIW